MSGRDRDDQLRGDVFPVRKGAWPAALTPAQLTDAETLKHEAGPTASGETTVRWLHPLEALVADEILVRPGQAAVDLAGTVAW